MGAPVAVLADQPRDVSLRIMRRRRRWRRRTLRSCGRSCGSRSGPCARTSGRACADQQLVVGQAPSPSRPAQSSANPIRRLPAAPAIVDLGAQRRQAGQPVGRRIGVREAAADRAAIAHGAVGDAARNRRRKPPVGSGNATVLDGRVRDGCTDGDGIGVLARRRQAPGCALCRPAAPAAPGAG